ncbi:MAG: aspartate kinase [SAR202 cluster bacterium Io17-Chloro-G9]|nr:MAG: aspartate kinase [SAR202 cluster bacterium Io17-Chloro-G9]
MPLVVQKYGGSSVADAQKILDVARRIGRAKELGQEIVAVVSAMGDTTDDLLRLAHTVSTDPDPRELDLLLSTGELVSCTLLTMALRSMGFAAVSLSGSQAGIQTDTMYGRARIHQIDPSRIEAELEKGNLLVVAGFQGITDEQDVTTLGRGGSDTTAVALAVALGAQRCEIYTDVEGIYTADPRVVPLARKLDEIGFQEMLEMASSGAKMHPRSIELGAAYNVPIYVASSFGDATGTLIHQKPDEATKDNMSNNMSMEDRIKVTAIVSNTNVAKITVRALPDRPGVAAALFEPLAQMGISVDTIVQNTSVERATDISFTVSRTDLAAAVREVQEVLPEVGADEVISDSTLASVSVVGSGMQYGPGYASRMFRILADGNVNIDMITTSEIRISCIVNESQVEDAVRLLHHGFDLDQDTEPS